MSNVTASRGVLEPVSTEVLPEVEIVCRMAMAALPHSKVDWARCMHDYAPIRELIAAVYPEIYTGFNERIQQPHGFHLDIPPRRRVWPTPNGKANILVMPGLTWTIRCMIRTCCGWPPCARMISTTPPSTATTIAIAACTTIAWCCS